MMVSHSNSSWIEECSYEQSIRLLTGIALKHADMAGPYSTRLREIIEGRMWSVLVDFSVDYNVGNVDDLYHTRQALALFQKLEPLECGRDKAKTALDSFVAAEEVCRRTNRRLRSGSAETNPHVESVLLLAQRKIAHCLGDVPNLSDLHFTFGPGANTGVKSPATSPRFKLDAPLECSSELAPAASRLLQEFPAWLDAHTHSHEWDSESNSFETSICMVNVVPGKLQFVPKNAKTYRSICVEPVLNSIAQKGIGSYLKDRLRKVGINLRDQERNKLLARVGSLNGQLATVDLSAASDTISRETVAELLPLDWFSFLSNFRTGKVTMPGGELVTLEKFSSMGNAYTFELESLIFWGLSFGVCAYLNLPTQDLSVFGDDIIVPVGAVGLLTDVFEHLGFSVNSEKSFSAGPFRESCGGDYYRGIDIRPFYQKSLVSAATLFCLHNYYMRTFQLEMAEYIRELIHPSLLIFGPDGYGDGHLIGDWDQSARIPKKTKERGYGGVCFDTFSLKKRRIKRRCQKGDAVLPVYSIYTKNEEEQSLAYLDADEQASDHFIVRGASGYRRLSIYTFSPWIFSKF